MFDLKDVLIGWAYNQRQNQRWQKSGYQEVNESKRNLFKGQPELLQLEKELSTRYPLISACAKLSTLNRYQENLNVIEALNQLSDNASLVQWPEEPAFEEPLKVMEVGVKNWSTLQATAAWLNVVCPQGYHLDGVEIDPWRKYQDGHSRYDYAQYFTKQVPQASYICGDVRQVKTHYHLIMCILPFVFLDPHQAWGLPKNVFDPTSFFHHLSQCLLPGGYMVLVNQGEDEWQEQAKLIEPYGYQVCYSGPVNQSFYTYQHPRYGWLVHRRI